jgi:hypothetical protein
LQEWAQIRHFVPHPWQSKGLWKAGLRIWVTNLALRASSSAIKRVTKGGIAHLGHQFGTSCLIPGNQKVSEWIAEHLWQIDGLQIRHFVPHLAIKKWQLREKQLCEGVPAPEQYHVTMAQ